MTNKRPQTLMEILQELALKELAAQKKQSEKPTSDSKEQ